MPWLTLSLSLSLSLSLTGAMDTFARGLRNAVKLMDEGVLTGAVKQRYSSYDSGIGAKIEKGETSLEELEVKQM